MPLEPFDQLYPEYARADMRVCDAPGLAEHGLSTVYFLREFYCTDPDCDCRRVVVQFLPKNADPPVAASINFGWEKAKYYRKWSHDPELWREMAGATLEPFAEQGPHKRTFLSIFNKVIEDHRVVAAFRRHYGMVKEGLQAPTIRRSGLL